MRTELPSVCPLDCPDTCSLTVTVEDGRIGAIRGSRANPYTDGVLCAKVPACFPGFVHGPGRLTGPLRRTGARGEGRFERISWAAALDLIYERFQQVIRAHGPQAILPLNYAGPHGFLAGGSMDLRFFHRLGASRLDRRPLCGGVRTEAWLGTYGPTPGIPPEQVALARLVVVWGNNVTGSNLHLMRPITRARKERGARLVVVDPRRTKVAEQADLHLALRPGTDVVLAWAVAALLEQEGGVDGGSGVRAVFALPALAGKWGVPGGGCVNGAAFAFPKTPARLGRPELTPPGTRTLNILDVGRHLTDPTLAPPIQAVFIYNHNPLIVHPDQNRLRRGLARPDLFVVGCDVVMTDSLAWADVVLPACSHFEHDDLFPSYGQHWLQRAAPVIPRQGEALPNTEIFRRLAARFGFTEPAFTATDAELMDEALDPADPRLQGLRPSQVPLDRALPMRVDGAEAVLFGNVRPRTPSGKVELASDYLDRKFGARLPTFRPVTSRFPLALLSPASERRITSTFGGVAADEAAPPLQMHPADARARGLADGQRVRVFNDLGEVHLPLRITDAVPPGVVATPKGAWLRTSDNGQTVSALCPSHHADLAEGACFNDARVEVAPLDGTG